MNHYALVLVLVSALLHIGWNLVGKSSNGSIRFYQRVVLLAAGLTMPIIIYVQYLLGWPSFQFILLLVMSGFFQMLYMASLSMAYQQGDIGVVYPIARAVPVLLLALFSMVFFGIDWNQALLGAGLIVLGSLLVPLMKFSQMNIQRYRSRSCFWALIAALGTVGYSLTDSHAMQLLSEPKLNKTQLPALLLALYFLGCQFVFAAMWLSLLPKHIDQPSNSEATAYKVDNKQALLAGVMMGATYVLVLIAMTLESNISYIVALRQVSIPLSVLIGIWWLKESFSWPRLIGAIIISVGIIFVA